MPQKLPSDGEDESVAQALMQKYPHLSEKGRMAELGSNTLFKFKIRQNGKLLHYHGQTWLHGN